MKITVDLTGSYDEQSLEDQLLSKVATQLIHGPWKDSATLDAVRAKAEAEVKRKIAETTSASIESLCEEILAEGIAQTDNYGRPKGDKIPLREICRNAIIDSMSRNQSSVSNIVKTLAGKALSTELQSVVKRKITELSADIDADFYARLAVEYKKKAGIR